MQYGLSAAGTTEALAAIRTTVANCAQAHFDGSGYRGCPGLLTGSQVQPGSLRARVSDDASGVHFANGQDRVSVTGAVPVELDYRTPAGAPERTSVSVDVNGSVDVVDGQVFYQMGNQS